MLLWDDCSSGCIPSTHPLAQRACFPTPRAILPRTPAISPASSEVAIRHGDNSSPGSSRVRTYSQRTSQTRLRQSPPNRGVSHHPHPSTETVLSIPDTSVTNSQVLAGGTALSASPRSRAAGQALSEVLGFKPKHFVKSKLPQRGTEELRYPKPAAGADLEPISGLLDYLFMVLLFLSQAQFTLCVSSRRLGGLSPTQEHILQPPEQPRSSRLPKRTVH